ncbi:zinc phosphodiesterase ELAC protein 1-like [Tubulanus polymorphus]|uniref:zinc phosphodiesterase ELAC protein 1-like n=1 Tax=Tubulanus polymorphus TaxID=672921 RepID=UPI003DA69B85
MEITFLGTGSAYPSPKRGVSCTALKQEDGQIWLFDCGEGSRIQIQRSQLKPGKISKIFITHLHGDHLFGLPGLLCTISQNNLRDDAVEIYGPLGLRKFIRVALTLSRSQLGFNYKVHELDYTGVEMNLEDISVDHTTNDALHPNEIEGETFKPDENGAWNIFSDSMMSVKAGYLQHRVPTFGYLITESTQPGSLNAVKLKALGIPPGPLYSKVKSGQSIISPTDGSIINPSDVIGADKPGRKILILGDTCDSNRLVTFTKDVDVLIHEATLENDKLSDAMEKGHSTPGMAAEFANAIGARKLVLTHFSQRYRSISEIIRDGDDSVQTLVDEAQLAFNGEEVIAADDFMVLPIPRRKTIEENNS